MSKRGTNIDLIKGQVGFSKVGVLEGVVLELCMSTHMKHECSSNLVSIGHQMNAPRDCMTIHQNHVYFFQYKKCLKMHLGGGMSPVAK